VATFGKTTDGTGQSQSSTDRKKVSSAVPASSGTATSITIRGRVTAESTVIKGVIYADNAGAPGALLAVSDEITVNSTTEQNWTGALTGGNQIAITSGTTYWIGWIQQDPGSGFFEISRDTTAGLSQTNTDTYADGPTNPFGVPSAEAGPVDVFVTYTEPSGGGSAEPLIRGATGASGVGNGASAVVTKPSGLAVGDLLLAFQVGDNDAALANMTGPSGWATIASQAAAVGGQPAMKVWQQVATSTETAASSFTFSAGSGIQCSAGILAITADTFLASEPLFVGAVFQINAASSTSHTAPSIGTGVTNGLLVTAHSTDQHGAASCSYTPPTGMTERVDTAASSGYTCLEINTLVLTSAGATGAKTATCTANRPSTCVSLIVAPATTASGINLARRTGGFLQLL
jgi:hypothetical protein